MGYVSLTDADRSAMLETIGASSVDELFDQIPSGVRLDRALEVEPALTEAEIVRLLEELAGRNAHTGVELSFLGVGVQPHSTLSPYTPVLALCPPLSGQACHAPKRRR